MRNHRYAYEHVLVMCDAVDDFEIPDGTCCLNCGDYGCALCGYCEACGVPQRECECERIHDLMGCGHTEHCAKRQVWGDGECDCEGRHG